MNYLTDIIDIDFNSFIGRELGSVTVLKELGHGSRGVVFIAFQKSLKRQVAVKVLPKICISDDSQRQQFQNESEIIAILSHPNIIPIFEVGENDDFYYQIMQLIVGEDLNIKIKRQYKHPVTSLRILPLRQSIEIVIQVLDGLAYAHNEGIVHHDIKPANILLEKRSQRPLISDFGISKAIQIENQSSTPGIIVGSPVYLSPEQAAAKETDKRSDIYSVGVLLFKLLAGELPYRDEPVENIILRKMDKPNSFFTKMPSEASSIINRDLEKIILQSIEPNIENRYQDCNTFKDDLLWYQDKYLT